MYKKGVVFIREAENDLPRKCVCCDPARTLIMVPDATGASLVCPSSRLCLKVRNGCNVLIPGVFVGATTG